MTEPQFTANAYGEADLIDFSPRCWRCEKLLAEYATRPWRCKCVRCKATNQAGDVPPGAPPANVPEVKDASVAISNEVV